MRVALRVVSCAMRNTAASVLSEATSAGETCAPSSSAGAVAARLCIVTRPWESPRFHSQPTKVAAGATGSKSAPLGNPREALSKIPGRCENGNPRRGKAVLLAAKRSSGKPRHLDVGAVSYA